MDSIRVLALILACFSLVVSGSYLFFMIASLTECLRDEKPSREEVEKREEIEKIREAKRNEISDQWSKWIEEHQEEMVAELIASDEEGGN